MNKEPKNPHIITGKRRQIAGMGHSLTDRTDFMIVAVFLLIAYLGVEDSVDEVHPYIDEDVKG